MFFLTSLFLSLTPPPHTHTHARTHAHKQELKAQKEASKRLGKKKKDEVAAAEAALAARHAAELKSLEDEEESAKGNGNAAAAAADSLSRFKLDGDDKDSKKELPTLRKGSKAARKRAERLAADAEREARRDSERAAAAGTGAGSLEAKELKATVLRPLGLEVFDVPADGHCLYAALSHQLEQAKKLRRKQNEEEGGGGHEEGGEGGDNNSSTSCSSDFSVKSLRALAARHIREHASAFEPFIDDEELLEGEGEQERTEQGEGGGGTETSKVERYCRRLEGTAAWGGQPELQALASSLPATIKVLSVGMEPVVVEGEGGNKGPVRIFPPLFFLSFFFHLWLANLFSLCEKKRITKKQELTICYLRHAFGLGEHYNSTVAKGKGGEIDSNSDESEGEGEGEAEEEEEKDGE